MFVDISVVWLFLKRKHIWLQELENQSTSPKLMVRINRGWRGHSCYLDLQLYYAHDDLYTYATMEYEAKIDPRTHLKLKPDDVVKALSTVVPAGKCVCVWVGGGWN